MKYFIAGLTFGIFIIVALNLSGCGNEGKEREVIAPEPAQCVIEEPEAPEELEEAPEEQEPVNIHYKQSACNSIDIFTLGEGEPTFAVYSSRLFMLGNRWITLWSSSGGSKFCKLKLNGYGELRENYSN